MKKIFKWKLGMAITAFILSLASAGAEMRGKESMDAVSTVCDLIDISAFVVMDILLFFKTYKNNVDSEDIEDEEKVKNTKLRRKRSLWVASLLLILASAGMILHFNDANIIIQNILDVLFALGLVIEVIIDLSEYKNFNQ